MTFKEKLKQEQAVGGLFIGGDRGCPCDYEYEAWNNRPCKDRVADCEKCWNREMPEPMPMPMPMPLVRCKDCKYSLREDEQELWCNGFCSPARLVCPDDFCSHGCMKEGLRHG